MDIQKSLLTFIYNKLTLDADLKSAMGGTVRLFLTWASPDAQFPYLVHRIDMRSDSLYFPRRRATYLLDLWSHSDNADEILAIRARLITLLHKLEIITTEVTGGSLWLQADGFVPETEQGIWHYATQWALNFYRASEVENVNEAAIIL